MFDGSDLCWIPRVPIGDAYMPRMRVMKFGDGYEQRVFDGINSIDVNWSLTWEMKPEAEIVAMDAYLAAAKGAAFVFRHPVTLIDYSVFCDDWQVDWIYRSSNGDRYGTLSAEFRQANGLTVTAIS